MLAHDNYYRVVHSQPPFHSIIGPGVWGRALDSMTPVNDGAPLMQVVIKMQPISCQIRGILRVSDGFKRLCLTANDVIC